MTTESASTSTHLKLPQFWPDQAEVWFAQAEAQFQVKQITRDDSKFHYVVAALDQHTAGRLLDLLREPPLSNKFQAIKSRLLGTFTLSDYERAGALLELPELGDDKPTVLMDKMLSLLPLSHQPCFLFRRIFLNHLPEDIRAVLVHSKIEDSRELAKAADQLLETRKNSICALRRPAYNMDGQMRKSKENIRRNPSYCFYHDRFGNKAHKCIHPCAYPRAAPSGNDQAGHQ